MKENEPFDYGMAWVLSAVVAFFYFILGSFALIMSGTFNILLILIYSAVSSFLVAGWIFRDNASEAQIGSGMIFIVSSIIFLHTSAPIWGEEYYCQVQKTYWEVALESYYEDCMSQGGFSYMMKRGEAQPTLLTLSSIATAISLLVLIGSSVGQLNFNSSSSTNQQNKLPKSKDGSLTIAPGRVKIGGGGDTEFFIKNTRDVAKRKHICKADYTWLFQRLASDYIENDSYTSTRKRISKEEVLQHLEWAISTIPMVYTGSDKEIESGKRREKILKNYIKKLEKLQKA